MPVQVSAPGPRARVPRAWAAEVPLAELALAVRAAVRLVELVPAVLGQVVALPAPVWARAALEPGPPVCLFSRTLALLCTTARGAVRRPYPSALIISRCKVSLHVRKLHASLRMLWWGKGCVSSQQSWKSCTNVVEAATDTHTHTHTYRRARWSFGCRPLWRPLWRRRGCILGKRRAQRRRRLSTAPRCQGAGVGIVRHVPRLLNVRPALPPLPPFRSASPRFWLAPIMPLSGSPPCFLREGRLAWY